jgi:hypothetical protein
MRHAPALAFAGVLSTFAALPAFAHHGWSWTEDGFFELRGTVSDVSYGNPHPVMTVDANGESWRVELATPAATTRAGFTAETAKTGDTITAIGNRSRDETEKRMKAVRVLVGGKTYDVYPSRVPD